MASESPHLFIMPFLRSSRTCRYSNGWHQVGSKCIKKVLRSDLLWETELCNELNSIAVTFLVTVEGVGRRFFMGVKKPWVETSSWISVRIGVLGLEYLHVEAQWGLWFDPSWREWLKRVLPPTVMSELEDAPFSFLLQKSRPLSAVFSKTSYAAQRRLNKGTFIPRII